MESTQAKLTAAAAVAQQKPPEPKKPKVQVLRTLLDQATNKAARAQFDAEGGLTAINVPELKTMSKAQAARYHNFVYEFMGERIKMDFFKRRAAELAATKAAAAVTEALEGGEGNPLELLATPPVAAAAAAVEA